MVSKIKMSTQRLPNTFVRLRGRGLTQAQEFSEDELVAILLMAEAWDQQLVNPETTHDLGAHEFGKVVRSIMAKLGV